MALRAVWTSRPLTVSGSTAVGPTGSATLELGPPPVNEAWSVARIAVSTSAGVAPQVRVYRDTPVLARFVDGTASGLSATSDYVPPLTLAAGEILSVVWTGATPGARANVIGQGTRTRIA